MNPAIYQFNPRSYLTEAVGRNATLDDIPESFIEALAAAGFDWVWPVGVWSVSAASRNHSTAHRGLRREFLDVLPDLTDQDVCGSPFAIDCYSTEAILGGDAALARFHRKVRSLGLKMMLDFVPNHVGLDHAWANQHPAYLIQGSEAQLLAEPDSWVRLKNGAIFAHGRDPNYAPWSDTLQLNYFNPGLRRAMLRELESVASRADGVRCDMAMLIEPEVFYRTWASRCDQSTEEMPYFWPDAISSIRAKYPEFLFLAEVYWGYEYKLQQHGFDYTYDKPLYDRIIQRRAAEVKDHLSANVSYQRRLTRFLENHDEPRIASKLSFVEHRAAAVVTFLTPGMRFFHDGQMSGKRLRLPVHLSRAPREKSSHMIEELYKVLLPIINSPTGKHGVWNMLGTREAWPNNTTHQNFIAFLIEHPLRTLLVAVNFASYRGQGFIRIPDRIWLEGTLELRDLLSHERLVRDSSDLRERGLFLDCSEWHTHIFSVEHS
ncbi:MAG: alpha-amylase family glycosyl hydrolase [Pseudomonadota bacterium]